nr:hypothetical protein [uncultured Rhodopila sp.]
MTAQSDVWLAYLQRFPWLTHAPARLVNIAPMTGGRWSLGDVVVSEAELLAARPDGPVEQIRLFHLVHGGWRVASFRQFRPLVYFSAFGSPDIFACLKLAVSSLVERGRWQWDVLVLTAADTIDTVRTLLAPCGLGERLHLAVIEPASGQLGWYLARYRLDAHPIMRTAQPLLYLDVDMICDAPLEPLLAALAVSPAINACAEGRLDEGGPDSGGHWFGWRLMQDDGMPFDPSAPGFSSGALGMASAESADIPFSLILRSRYADAMDPNGGHKLASKDQAFANYVLRKLGRHETGLLPRVLNLHRLGGALHPNPADARGLVHFLGAPVGEKVKAMQAYLDCLRR